MMLSSAQLLSLVMSFLHTTQYVLTLERGAGGEDRSEVGLEERVFVGVTDLSTEGVFVGLSEGTRVGVVECALVGLSECTRDEKPNALWWDSLKGARWDPRKIPRWESRWVSRSPGHSRHYTRIGRSCDCARNGVTGAECALVSAIIGSAYVGAGSKRTRVVGITHETDRGSRRSAESFRVSVPTTCSPHFPIATLQPTSCSLTVLFRS